jgi:peptidoglycan/LPS O-acetylase OafA/YrhL
MKDAPYRALGAFRLVLAITVVLSHTWFLTFSYRSFVQDLGVGNFAVMGFFVLSGFIIYEEVDVFYRDRPVAFLGNRLLRLVPPYWAAAIVSILVHAILLWLGILKLPDYTSLPGLMFDPRNMAVQVTGIFPVFNVNRFFPKMEWYYFVRFAWAIFVEFVFYFLIGACLVLLPVAQKISSIRVYLASTAVAVLGVHIFSEYVHPLHTSVAFFPYFVLGAAIYCARVRGDAVAGSIAALSYVLVAIHFLRYAQGQLSFYVNWWNGATRPVVFIPTLTMLAIPFLLALMSGIRLPDRLARIDQSLGDLTYPLYLNHYTVLVAAYSFFPEPNWVVQAATVVASFAASLTLQRLIEGPMSKVRDRIRGHRLIAQHKVRSESQDDRGFLVARADG